MSSLEARLKLWYLFRSGSKTLFEPRHENMRKLRYIDRTIPLLPQSKIFKPLFSGRPARFGSDLVGTLEDGFYPDAALTVPSFFSTACKKPPVFKDAVPAHVTGFHMKSMATYRCLTGGQPIGNPHLFCLANGHWSKRRFSCGST